MSDHSRCSHSNGWTYEETTRRQNLAGLEMTAAQRLAWLEEMLDELLPLLGRARAVEREAEDANRPD